MQTSFLRRAGTAGMLACSLIAAILAPRQLIAQTSDSLEHALQPLLSGSWRSAANRARDQYRHPVQTLEFFGVRPDQTVIELLPGSTNPWYAELLAPLLHDRGQYIAAIVDGSKSADPKVVESGKRTADSLAARFAAAPAQFGKARIVSFELKSPKFGPDNSADVVLTFRNVHNWVKRNEVSGMFQAMYAVLKPGGTLGVVDHRAAPGSVLKDVLDTGYLPVEFVIAEAQAAGFQLAGQSEVNANPKDTRDHEKGVWTLPPVYALDQTDRARYAAIGESDRFTLRFLKPAK